MARSHLEDKRRDLRREGSQSVYRRLAGDDSGREEQEGSSIGDSSGANGFDTRREWLTR